MDSSVLIKEYEKKPKILKKFQHKSLFELQVLKRAGIPSRDAQTIIKENLSRVYGSNNSESSADVAERKQLKGKTHKETILRVSRHFFDGAKKGRLFEPNELVEYLKTIDCDINPGTVGTTLRKLEKEKYMRRRKVRKNQNGFSYGFE